MSPFTSRHEPRDSPIRGDPEDQRRQGPLGVEVDRLQRPVPIESRRHCGALRFGEGVEALVGVGGLVSHRRPAGQVRARGMRVLQLQATFTVGPTNMLSESVQPLRYIYLNSGTCPCNCVLTALFTPSAPISSE